MKKLKLKKIIKEIYEDILNEAQFIGRDTLYTLNFQKNISIPISAKITIVKNNYDDEDSTYAIKLDYDEDKLMNGIKNSLKNELEKVIKKYYNKNEPEFKNVLNRSGASLLVNFPTNFVNKYK